MDFSINYSTQAAVLFSQGRLVIERYKCPDWPDLIAEACRYCQVAVHFDLNAGRSRLTLEDLDRAGQIAEHTDTPFINLHLEAKTSDFRRENVSLSDADLREQFFQRAVGDIRLAVERFGSEKVVVENVPFRSSGNVLKASVEPEMINRILVETGCSFLLDIPHACITAHYLGMDERDYIHNLPVKKIRELHFTGVHWLGNRLQDHLPALEKDWEVLNWVLEQIRLGEWSRPWMLAFEYGGVGEKFAWRSSAKAIEEQSKRLHALVSPI